MFNFWSDNACHFRCFELYNHILKEIPEKYESVKCTLNFFNEYHGKSEIDGHFGELQRIYDRVNKTIRVKDIKQLMNIFTQSMDIKKDTKKVYFEIYSREERPQKISKMKILGSNKYLSFVKRGNRLYGCGVSSSDMNDYIELDYEVKEVDDKRTTKYSFYKSNGHGTYYLGSRTINLISSRYKITKNKFFV